MHTSLEYYPFLLEIPGQLLDMIDLEVLHIPTAREYICATCFVLPI